MGRRRKKGEGLADIVVELTSRVPWWAGVLLAIVSYFLLHSFASTPPPKIVSGQVGTTVPSMMLRGFATVGQYVLPLLFVLGAVVSALNRRKANQLHAEAANRADGLSRMNWREFEVLVEEYFRRQGFSVLNNGGGGPDGGVDLLMQKGSDRYLVQCKHWRALRVGVEPIREMYGVMAAERVAGGFVVTSGEFTDEARRFAEGRELKLVNGKALQQGVRAQAKPEAKSHTPDPATEPMRTPASPNCPSCGAEMVLRKARQGAQAGQSFWGCSKFAQTKCRGTRPV